MQTMTILWTKKRKHTATTAAMRTTEDKKEKKIANVRSLALRTSRYRVRLNRVGGWVVGGGWWVVGRGLGLGLGLNVNH